MKAGDRRRLARPSRDRLVKPGVRLMATVAGGRLQ
jgi:hypothetical protein